MADGLYRQDPLTPDQREEFEGDLISFSDDELDLLGDLRGLDVLYAGGSSLLWIEGLAQRIGDKGSVIALDLDDERVKATTESVREADPSSSATIVVGDVFDPPFGTGTFDLVYSAGLFHEMDVSERSADGVAGALAALASIVRPGGRISTSDFVDSVPAIQLEDEVLDAELAREASGKRLFGVGPPERLVALHEKVLSDVWWRVSPPRTIRHLGELVLAGEEPPEFSLLRPGVAGRLRERREGLRGRVGREGYTRPATVYVEGVVRGG